MIAKIMAYGRDRAEALSRLRRALSQTSIVLGNGMTNKPFLQQLLARPEFALGAVDIGWVDGIVADPDRHASEYADIAIVAAAITAYEEETQLECNRFRAASARGRPEVDDSIGHSIELGYSGTHTTPMYALWGPGDTRSGSRARPSVWWRKKLGPYVKRLTAVASANGRCPSSRA